MKNFRQQQHRPKKNTLVIGREAVIDAMKSGKQLERIFFGAMLLLSEIFHIAKLSVIGTNKKP